MSTSSLTVFRAFVDDAAMFPPGNADPATAIAEHLRYRATWFAALVGPLLVPARAWDEFVGAHQAAGSPDITVVLIGTTTLPPHVPAGVTVAGFEVQVADVPLPIVPPGLSLAAELSLGASGGRVLAAVAEQAAEPMPVIAKFRTGGTVSDAFPSEEVLTGFLLLAVGAAAPFKLTAGLHHAVRFTDEGTGFEHHGFLNVLVGVAHALAGADAPAVVAVLAERDSAVLVAQFRALSGDQAMAARRSFVSFGCCGVEDPIGDLVALDLIKEPG